MKTLQDREETPVIRIKIIQQLSYYILLHQNNNKRKNIADDNHRILPVDLDNLYAAIGGGLQYDYFDIVNISNTKERAFFRYQKMLEILVGMCMKHDFLVQSNENFPE